MGLIKKYRLKNTPTMIDYPDDVERFRVGFNELNAVVDDLDIQFAYREYSADEWCAGWLILPEKPEDLLLLCSYLLDNYFVEDKDWTEAYDRATNY